MSKAWSVLYFLRPKQLRASVLADDIDRTLLIKQDEITSPAVIALLHKRHGNNDFGKQSNCKLHQEMKTMLRTTVRVF